MARIFQKSLGTAFEGIPPGTYYPAVCLYYGEVQVTLNPKAKIPSAVEVIDDQENSQQK